MSGCSKDELEESVTEGVSAVATPTNGQARFANPVAIPEVWFNQNQGRMVIQFNGRRILPQDCRPNARISYSIAGGAGQDGNATEETVVIEAELMQVGNSKTYRSDRNRFLFGQTDHFSIIDVTIDAGTYVEEWGGETLDLELFLYPSGRTVEQAPKLVRARLIGRWSFDDAAAQESSTARLAVILADDPAQLVAQVKFVPTPTVEDPNDPTTVEPLQFERTHFNQALGLSRWVGPGRGGSGSSPRFEGAIYLRGGDKYDAEFVQGETNAVIIARYNITQNANGSLISVLSDEPEILGSRIGSRDGGATWIVEVAIADLGNWVNTVNYRFLETNGPAPLQQEVTLFLVRQEGNLKVYSNKVFFDGNPKGSDYQALISNLGTGTRTTTGQANNKAELL